MREGTALLQGLAACGHCGRACTRTIADAAPRRGIIAPGKILVEGRGVYCLNVGGIQIGFRSAT